MPTHAILRLQDDALICPTAALRRAVTRSIARIGAVTGLVAWAFPDNHGHLAVLDTPAAASHLAWRVELAVQAHRAVGAGPFQPRWLRSDSRYGYLRNMTDYILRQSAHHGTVSDPFAEADARLDILGLRLVAPWVRPRVREVLPRLRDEEVAEALGLSLEVLREWAHPLEPGDGVEQLGEAVLATFCTRSIRERSPTGARARAAAVLACPGVRPAALRHALGISGEVIRRIRSGRGAIAGALVRGGFDSPVVRAVAVQARWRARAGALVDSAVGEPTMVG